MDMTITIFVAIGAFLAITLLLVVLLLYAKAKLTSSGAVTIDINNGERVITTESGSTLLATLADNKVFLPSACGGGGSCGMCKCQVLEGGGDILPTETGFISRKMAKDHWRLGCQVKVKENLKIKVPEAVLGVKKWECTVVSNRNISTFLKEFVVKLPEGENLKFRSGGYIQVDIPKYDRIAFSDMEVDEPFRADWDRMKMWGQGDKRQPGGCLCPVHGVACAGRLCRNRRQRAAEALRGDTRFPACACEADNTDGAGADSDSRMGRRREMDVPERQSAVSGELR